MWIGWILVKHVSWRSPFLSLCQARGLICICEVWNGDGGSSKTSLFFFFFFGGVTLVRTFGPNMNLWGMKWWWQSNLVFGFRTLVWNGDGVSPSRTPDLGCTTPHMNAPPNWYKNREQYKYKGKDKNTKPMPKTAIQRIHNWGQKQCGVPYTYLSAFNFDPSIKCCIAACIWCHRSSSLWSSQAVPCGLHLKYHPCLKWWELRQSRGGWLIDWLTGLKMAQSIHHPSENMERWAEQRATE